MSEATAHPPRPHLAIRVGLIGKRELPAQQLPRIRKQTEELLAMVQEKVRQLQETEAECFAAEAPRMLAITSLAAGADQLAADAALAKGYLLHVLLPFREADYCEHTLGSDEAAHQEYARLAAKAEKILELDGVAAGQEINAYDAAASLLVRSSDLLVAIWDGVDIRKPGGTADTIAKAKLAGVPVVWIHSLQDVPPSVLGELEPRALLVLQEELDRILKVEDKANWLRFLGEKERRWNLSPVYEFFAGLLARTIRLRWPRNKGYVEKSDGDWAAVPRAGWTDVARHHFKPFDLWADNLAIYTAGMTRGLYTLIIAMGSLAVLSSQTSRLFFQGDQRLQFDLSFLEAMIGICLLVLFVWARWGDYHRRWMHYRTLAELLRTCALTAVTGEPARLAVTRRAGQANTSSWVVCFAAAIVRSFGLTAIRPDDNYNEGCRQLLLARMEDQRKYHLQRYETSNSIAAAFRLVGLGLFVLSISGCLLQILTLTNLGSRFGITQPVTTMVNTVAVYAGLVAAAIAGFVTQAEFAKLAQSSAMIIPRLEALSLRLRRDRVSGPLLRLVAREASETLLEEHEDWHLFYSLREIEYPR